MENNMKQLKEHMMNSTLMRWQTMALQKLVDQDDRKILFIVDEKGGAGRSFFSMYLLYILNAERFENAKSVDVKYAWQTSKYCCFDLRRSQIDHINYEIIESIKNGCVFSTKYNSTPKLRLGSTKVIVFMNAMPDKTKLSSDR